MLGLLLDKHPNGEEYSLYKMAQNFSRHFAWHVVLMSAQLSVLLLEFRTNVSL